MIRRPPRSTQGVSSAASDVYKRQYQRRVHGMLSDINKQKKGTMTSRCIHQLDSQLFKKFVNFDLLPSLEELFNIFMRRLDIQIRKDSTVQALAKFQKEELKSQIINLIFQHAANFGKAEECVQKYSRSFHELLDL
eukprot:TRINITY_DN4614_c0_g1_i6.p1 TRINITY_DN4614_c0_g1~~TRINITY_DN4614_c0_g1_i6.p1  ORF type:complete len:136 (-),score=36.54 TRINITY_DN4614_c0_g1_i6:216-623(-)